MFQYCVDYDDAGFTDQIMQYYLASKVLGRLGGEYRHAGFGTRRNGKELWELLGVEALFNDERMTEEERAHTVPIDLNEPLADGAGLEKIEAAIRRFRTRHPSAISRVDIRPIRRKLAALIDADYAGFPFEPDVRLAGLPARWSAAESDLPLAHDAVNVVAHIRLGDAWEGELPEGRALCVRDEGILPSRRQPSVGEILALLSAILRGLPETSVRLLVFSDGFARTKNLIGSRRAELTPGEAAHLDAALASDEAALEMFGELPGTTLYAGEGNRDLRRLCAALFRADVVLAFGHQRLCAKALSFFGGSRVKPLYFQLSLEPLDHQLLVPTLLHHKAVAKCRAPSPDTCRELIDVLERLSTRAATERDG